MRAGGLLPLELGLALTACATMSMREIEAVNNCARIDRQVAALEK